MDLSLSASINGGLILKKLKLHGFNNLTKTLSFNIYDVCYASTEAQQKEYISYIDEAYSALRLTEILTEVAHVIGANILNVSYQDYDPQGASVTMLIAEEPILKPESSMPASECVVGHLDKSHITVHTYPESHPRNGISTFRADIDVSTCGLISPLKALTFLLTAFETDIVTIDYRVRGFTRKANGKKLFIDHPIYSIQNYLPEATLQEFDMIDVNIYQENLFHTKMLLKNFDLDNYLFGIDAHSLSHDKAQYIREQLRREMLEIFYGRNFDGDKSVLG